MRLALRDNTQIMPINMARVVVTRRFNTTGTLTIYMMVICIT